jgi:hypothetical protein
MPGPGKGGRWLLWAAAIAVAGAAPAQQPAPRPITIRVPSELVLGEDEKAPVEIEISGALAPGTKPRVRASAGEVADLAEGGRSMVGVYRPPSTLFPQVAILGAVGKVDGKTIVTFQPLPLYGIGDLPVSGKRGQALTVKVGPLTFGPVKAGRNGRATIRIKVPPGYDSATANGKRVELGESSFKRILAMSLEEQVAADGVSTTGIQAMVVDKYGKPDPLARVFARVERGKVSPVSPIGPGLYSATYTAPAEVGPGVDKVTFGVVGEEISRDVVTLKLVRGAARKVNAWVDPAYYQVGNPPPMVWVSVADAAGNPLDATVDLEAEVGKFGPPRKAGPGKYVAPFSPPDQFQGRTEVTIVASASTPGSTAVKREVTLGLKPGRPHQVRVEGKHEGVADGRTHVEIDVQVVDQNGNPIPSAPLTVKADQGRAEPPEPTPTGYTVRYVPPLSFEPVGAVVTIQSEGTTQAEMPIHLAPAENLVLLGARVGYQSNLASMRAPGLAASLGARLSFLHPRLFTALELGLISTWPLQPALPGSDPPVASSLFIPSGALMVQYRAPVGPFMASAGAGPVLALLLADVSQEGFPSRSERLLAVGVEGSLGLGIRMGRTTIGVDGRYRHLPVAGSVVQGNAGGVLGSLRFDLEL